MEGQTGRKVDQTERNTLIISSVHTGNASSLLRWERRIELSKSGSIKDAERERERETQEQKRKERATHEPTSA